MCPAPATTRQRTMLFSQSREVHRQLRDAYRSELFGSDAAAGSVDPAPPQDGPTTMPLDDKRVAMMMVMELHHRQVFAAVQNNPISAMLSLGWTLSTTSRSVEPQMRLKRYYAIWSPFICITNTLTDLHRKFGAGGDDDPAAATTADRDELFDMEDVRAVDRAYFDSLRRQVNMIPDERQRLFLQRVNSELFTETLSHTPFGTYEIGDAPGLPRSFSADDHEWTIGGQRYTYVPVPLNVRDRQRYGSMFCRHEIGERLRRQTETQLRQRFAVYQRMYGVNVRPWLVAPHEEDPSSRGYAFYWQIQKSALVWVFYHTLAALVTVVNDAQLTGDFLATVLSMEHFIECGLCESHWREVYLPRWRAVNRQHQVFQRTCLATARPSPAVGGACDDGHAPGNVEVDLLLLHTHNEVQASTNPALRLTNAAIQALREDYLNVARCIVTAMSVRTVPRELLAEAATASPAERSRGDTDSNEVIEPRLDDRTSPLLANRFYCSVFDRERSRQDVCRKPWELWVARLREIKALYDCDSRERGYVKRSLLQLQWDRSRV